jgi:phage-related protein
MSNKTLGLFGMIIGGVIFIADLLVGLLGWPWLQNLVGFPSVGFGWRKITLLILAGLMILVSAVIRILAIRLEKIKEKKTIQ